MAHGVRHQFEQENWPFARQLCTLSRPNDRTEMTFKGHSRSLTMVQFESLCTRFPIRILLQLWPYL